MGGICQALDGQWFFCCSPFVVTTQARIFSYTTPQGGVTINNLELAALFAQVQLFAPMLDPLAHIPAAVDNTSAQGWDNRGSVSTA